MRRIVLKGALDISFRRVINERSLFITPEHLLLAFLGDSDLRILLASINVDPKVITEMLTEYVEGIPRFKKGGLPPVFSWAFPRIHARLKVKGLDLKESDTVFAGHFLEAYAYDGFEEEGHVPPCTVASLFAQRHSKIELAVYGNLPKA
jgi:ATP-dependent Clp protease ATP-binding subunit ClpA